MHSDQEYIRFLLQDNAVGIQRIYDKFARKVVALVRHNSGEEADGFDILQESLIDIYHMAKYKDFKLTTSFESFLLLVCKRKWLNELKKKSKREVTNVADYVLDVEDDSETAYRAHLETVEKERILMELVDTLGERCQAIIKGCMVAKHQEELATSLGLTYAYLRKKKSECMAKLREKVKAHSFFKAS